MCARKSPYALHPIDGVLSLALYPQVVSQAPQLVKVALPANLSARSFPFTLACPGQYTHRSLPAHITISDLVHSSRSHQCQADFLLLFFNCSDPIMLKLCSLVNTSSRSWTDHYFRLSPGFKVDWRVSWFDWHINVDVRCRWTMSFKLCTLLTLSGVCRSIPCVITLMAQWGPRPDGPVGT